MDILSTDGSTIREVSFAEWVAKFDGYVDETAICLPVPGAVQAGSGGRKPAAVVQMQLSELRLAAQAAEGHEDRPPAAVLDIGVGSRARVDGVTVRGRDVKVFLDGAPCACVQHLRFEYVYPSTAAEGGYWPVGYRLTLTMAGTRASVLDHVTEGPHEIVVRVSHPTTHNVVREWRLADAAAGPALAGRPLEFTGPYQSVEEANGASAAAAV